MADLFGNRRVPNPKPGAMGGFQSYAAGTKKYGAGRSMPNIGNVSGTGLQGYAERDQKAKSRKQAIMRRLKAQSQGNPNSSSILGVM
jgi:hypothetical protein